jgi:hypothetical protein
LQKKSLKSTFLYLSIIGNILLLCSWGTWGHQYINKAAVFALPEEIRSFFYNHIDFITEESVVPDIRKYTLNDKVEFARHYINIESFDKPIDSLPQTFKDATLVFDDNFLQKNGILPWYIQDMMEKLTKAFKEKRKTEILFIAADLGHYLGDAHMPLHTTLNHDGQLTNQIGIHAFWESQLPERFGNMYNFNTGKAKFIDDVTKETWRVIKNSYQMADTLLLIEKNLNASFPLDEIYKKDNKGNIVKNKFNQLIHSEKYAQKYHEALKGMVEKQMRLAVVAIADFWYTAWVNAGKPDLSSLDDPELTQQNKKSYMEDIESWEKGKITKLKIDTEF